MSSTLQIFLLALLGSIIALVGGFVFLFNKKWSKILEEYSVPFAAGVLITVSLIGILPEAVDKLGENAYLFVLIAFVGAYLFEHTFFQVHHHDSPRHGHTHSYKGSVPLIIFGDTIHNFIDGVAIASSFLVAPGLGLITAISTFLHEVPHEVSDFGILLKAGWTRKRVLLVNVISASMTIVGAFFVLWFLRDGPVIGALLSLSAGMFLYLGASDFLPHIEEEGKKPYASIVPFLVGVIIMYLTFIIIPHG